MRGGIGTILSGTSGWGHAPLPFVHLISGMIKLQFLRTCVRRFSLFVDTSIKLNFTF